VPQDEAIQILLERALAGHGWAATGTLAQTWRLLRRRDEIATALRALVEKGRIVACSVIREDNRQIPGWIRPQDLELAARLERCRPRSERGVLLSPFDPVLWDRSRVDLLFGFHQVLEIYKPTAQRIYGYYCLPVLAGDRLISRFDLKADRKNGHLKVLSFHPEDENSTTDRQASRTALERFAESLSLKPSNWT
jgi:uncharacterized protein YcaQ